MSEIGVRLEKFEKAQTLRNQRIEKHNSGQKQDTSSLWDGLQVLKEQFYKFKQELISSTLSLKERIGDKVTNEQL